MKYKVIITETLQMEVEVAARSLEEACEKVEQNWKDGDYILDADHFKGVTFSAETPDYSAPNRAPNAQSQCSRRGIRVQSPRRPSAALVK